MRCEDGMSRPLRIHAPGFLHHVVSRGNDKERIFTDDEDHECFLADLEDALERFDAHCAAYCLLSNHYHLLIVPREFPLWRIMHRLNSIFFRRFNRRHHRVGPRLQGRYRGDIIEDGGYARNALRYVALNPVAAGLAPRPEDWRWSSYRAALGLVTPPKLLSTSYSWGAFGTSDPGIGRARFAHFVSAGLPDDFNDALLYGSDRLAALMAPQLEPHRANSDFVYSHRFAARPPLADLLAGCNSPLRRQDGAWVAFRHHGYTLAEIGSVLHRDPSTVSRWVKYAASRRSL